MCERKMQGKVKEEPNTKSQLSHERYKYICGKKKTRINLALLTRITSTISVLPDLCNELEIIKPTMTPSRNLIKCGNDPIGILMSLLNSYETSIVHPPAKKISSKRWVTRVVVGGIIRTGVKIQTAQARQKFSQ